MYFDRLRPREVFVFPSGVVITIVEIIEDDDDHEEKEQKDQRAGGDKVPPQK